MRFVVVFESMFGNTRRVAEAVGRGLAPFGEVTVVPARDADRVLALDADLLVVGAPTHIMGLPRSSTRKAAADMAAKPERHLVLDEAAAGPGVEEWLEGLAAPARPIAAATFDTRLAYPLSGRASKRARRLLRHHGYRMLVAPESFFVDKDNRLRPGAEARAVAWGGELARALEGALGRGQASAA